jgi:hypothetical protein
MKEKTRYLSSSLATHMVDQDEIFGGIARLHISPTKSESVVFVAELPVMVIDDYLFQLDRSRWVYMVGQPTKVMSDKQSPRPFCPRRDGP